MKNILHTLEILGNLIAISTGNAIMRLLEEVHPGRVSSSWRIDALREASSWWLRNYPTPGTFNQANKTYEEKTAACLEYQREIINIIWLIILGE